MDNLQIYQKENKVILIWLSITEYNSRPVNELAYCWQ